MIRNAGAEAAASGKIDIPPEVDKRCTGAALPARRSLEMALAFGYAQTERLEVCDERRALGAAAMHQHNERIDELVKELKPKHWWEFWRN